MKAKVLKEKGLMETLLSLEKETILDTAQRTLTEQIPHWRSDDSICGYMRSKSEAHGFCFKEVSGHQRPC